MRFLLVPAMVLTMGSGHAQAQEVSVPSVTTASPGGYANPLKLDTDRYRRQQEARQPVRNQAARNNAARCSADAMPAADKRRIQAEYDRISRSQGRAAAVSYARQEGARFRQQLVARGVCPAEGGGTATRATAASSGTRSTVRNRNGQKCTRTTMQARNIANPGGGAMSMIMVPVCLD